MGGRGSGGRRVGAGRKPKDAVLRAIQGGRSRIPVQPAPVGSTEVPPPLPLSEVPPPADLTDAELVVWNREAPLALLERTLTPATAGAFRELCELEALKNQMLVKIKAELTAIVITEAGASERANPLLTHYRGAVQRLATFRKDFKLAPFGKELLTPAQPAARSAATPKRTYW